MAHIKVSQQYGDRLNRDELFSVTIEDDPRVIVLGAKGACVYTTSSASTAEAQRVTIQWIMLNSISASDGARKTSHIRPNWIDG
ncbi:hypothetical protein WJX77_007033 [Trebouxia sp. C0004]